MTVKGCEDHNIQSLEYMCGMWGVRNNVDAKLLCSVEKGEAGVRRMAIKNEDPWHAILVSCLLVRILKPLQR